MKSPRILLAITLAAAALPVWAGSSFEVGRYKVALAEDGWETVEVKLGKVNVDTTSADAHLGLAGSLDARTQLLTLRNADHEPMAVILVHVTYPMGGRPLIAGGDCPPIKGLYVNDFSKGRRTSPECVVYGGTVDGKAYAQKSEGEFAKAWELKSFDVPRRGRLLWSYFANSTGASISLQGLVALGLKGVDGAQPASPLPEGLDDAEAAWADALGDAARKALNSFSGELRLPPVSFF